MHNKLGIGDKATIGPAIDLGLSVREGYDHKTKLRDDTGDSTQRPKATTKSVSSDRGTFPSKC